MTCMKSFVFQILNEILFLRSLNVFSIVFSSEEYGGSVNNTKLFSLIRLITLSVL